MALWYLGYIGDIFGISSGYFVRARGPHGAGVDEGAPHHLPGAGGPDGVSVRGLGVAPGAVTELASLDTLHALQDVERLADAMALEKNFGKGAPVLRALYLKVKQLIFSFVHGRDGQSGTFGQSL